MRSGFLPSNSERKKRPLAKKGKEKKPLTPRQKRLAQPLAREGLGGILLLTQYRREKRDRDRMWYPSNKEKEREK